MGVTGLWTVVQPCARPIKLETLNRKRLAVDASIWIYQFLKAVRDKEGNALRNSHVVGFFRRICKLLFFGIKPVFVFDGGAPVLKRQTVSSRKARREGRREDAVRTAGKLLAVQMQRKAEEEEQRRREENDRPRQDRQEEEVPDDPVYVDELQMTAQERARNRRFRKKDAYHLPNLDVDIADLGAPNDPRIMSHEELEDYARQFHKGEDVAMYDFGKIDFDSAFFLSLPASDRYNILNAARLRSRLRMGHSKEQLDTMFPNRMDFSRFQIQRVKERNDLTQRLMNLNGMNDDAVDQTSRVAGEKGKEYVLVKNDGVEGGWALGVVTNKGEGERSKPIDVEGLDPRKQELNAEGEESDDDGFEDVPIEGVNRLPSRLKRLVSNTENLPFDSEDTALRRREVYEARLEKIGKAKEPEPEAQELEEAEALFVPQAGQDVEKFSEENELFEDVPAPESGEDAELQRAIAMSLENGEEGEAREAEGPTVTKSAAASPLIDQPLKFNLNNAKVGREFAHLTNARAHGKARKAFEDDNDEDDFNIRAGLEESRRTRHKAQSGPKVYGFKHPERTNASPQQKPHETTAPAAQLAATPGSFNGPLPFESINLGSSILGKRKKQPAAEAEGGFEKDNDHQEKSAQPLPPWFSGDSRDDVAKQKAIEEHQYEGGDPTRRRQLASNEPPLKRPETGEAMNIEALKPRNNDVIAVESSDEDVPNDVIMGESRPLHNEVRVTYVADHTRLEPPVSDTPDKTTPAAQNTVVQAVDDLDLSVKEPSQQPSPARAEHMPPKLSIIRAEEEAEEDGMPIDWSESEREEDAPRPVPDGGVEQSFSKRLPRSPTLATINDTRITPPDDSGQHQDIVDVAGSAPPLLHEESTSEAIFEGLDAAEDHVYSDPEDEALMRQLAGEAEEHARFASSLNTKSYHQNVEEYEKELRQLRNQQKKDRRDADEVSHIMVTECQQLLRLFGLPYITAPMEAEAQCAALVDLGLVDGIVTDDSDIFLFGGTRVYKNMFNQSKFVECYLSSDLEKEYGLTREKLIRFAHLLGSDYTEGLPSVGPVTALEILSEFETLEQFSEWWSVVQMAGKPTDEDLASPFRKKFRKNAAKIFLPNSFPDARVDHAYLNPEVDADPQAFQWGVPDLDALRQFLMATIGWSQERTDEVLVPVIKDINRRENEGTQANITQFFGGGVGVGARPNVQGNANNNEGQHFAPRRRVEKSKRIDAALGRLQGRARGKDGIVDGFVEGGNKQPEQPKAWMKGVEERGRKRPDPDAQAEDGCVNGSDEEDGDVEYSAPKKPKRKGRKKGKVTT